MSPQTTIQILRCLTLGGYTATVEDGELKIRGPQPLGGRLRRWPGPASHKRWRPWIVKLA